MLMVNSREQLDCIKGILQRTSYVSAEEYLAARISMDHQSLKRCKKLAVNCVK